jgi:hypothetical protein
VKTTIDLPDTLLHRAKVTAAQRRTTLKNLIVEGLERVMNTPSASSAQPASSPSEDEFFEVDAYGVPVMKRRGFTVTDLMIEKIREEEGI